MNASNRASLGHSFRDALAGEGLSIIAEIKRCSPSRGALRPDADAASLALEYRDGGAACLSVLTDSERFGGSVDDLRDAREAADLPVLRKDFLTDLKDVRESADMGADAILVILADVDPERMSEMQEEALRLGVDVLTEVRTEEELELAVAYGAYMIGVNQRDDPKNTRITVDYNRAERMAGMFERFDDGITWIALSGMGVPGGTPLSAIADAGYDAALIGEALVTAADSSAKLRELLTSCGSRPRVAATASS
ncbi:MAG: indole-3-glycerol-phosphate synthase [bacterium]|nr:indole-3-glycerol-phosphate synthase [bacterium]